MTLRYDEILSDNYFGQIIIPTSSRNKITPSSMTNHSNIITDEKKSSSLSLTEEFDFSIDELI